MLHSADDSAVPASTSACPTTANNMRESAITSAVGVLMDTKCPQVSLENRVRFLFSKNLTIDEISTALGRVNINQAEAGRLIEAARRAPAAPVPPPLPSPIDAGPLEQFNRDYENEMQRLKSSTSNANAPTQAVVAQVPRGTFLRAVLFAVAAGGGLCYSAANILHHFAPNFTEHWITRLRSFTQQLPLLAMGDSRSLQEQQKMEEAVSAQTKVIEELKLRVSQMEKSVSDSINGVLVAQMQLEKLISQLSDRIQEIDNAASDIKFKVSELPEFMSEARSKLQMKAPSDGKFQTLGYDEDFDYGVDDALKQLDSAKELSSFSLNDDALFEPEPQLLKKDDSDIVLEDAAFVPSENDRESTVTESSFKLELQPESETIAENEASEIIVP